MTRMAEEQGIVPWTVIVVLLISTVASPPRPDQNLKP
jgi:hypothetical protein